MFVSTRRHQGLFRGLTARRR